MLGDPIETAIKHLYLRNGIEFDGRTVTVAFLIHEHDWRPLRASWWSGKEVYIIGADLDGNFFLRHCDGSVRYWDHKAQIDTMIAPSVKEFVRQLF